MRDFIATASITINRPAETVWQALTDPAKIKQYLFGTTVTTDWKVGSPITYAGEWQGKQYEDKGVIVAVELNKLLETTYWSNMSGLPDVPENYNTVRYEITEEGSATRLTITQDNAKTKEAAEHSQKNWEMVLGTIKKLVEGE